MLLNAIAVIVKVQGLIEDIVIFDEKPYVSHRQLGRLFKVYPTVQDMVSSETRFVSYVQNETIEKKTSTQ
jgi:hypothetical protein